MIELIVAVAIIGIIAGPLFSAFYSATQNNIESGDKITAGTTAQDAMEKLKARPDVLAVKAGNGLFNISDSDYGISVPEGYTANAIVESYSTGSLSNSNTGNVNPNQLLDSDTTLDSKTGACGTDISFSLDQSSNQGNFNVRIGSITEQPVNLSNSNTMTLDYDSQSNSYTCRISDDSGIKRYRDSFIQCDTSQIRVRIDAEGINTQKLTLHVNIGAGVTVPVNFYILNDTAPVNGVVLINDGSTPINEYYLSSVSGYNAAGNDYTVNNLYRITITVSTGNTQGTISSFVKK